MKIIISVILLLPSLVFATQTYDCNFRNFSNPEGNKKEKMDITYLLDRSAEKAYVVGPLGSNEIIFVPNKMGGVTFIEITATGNVITTTVTTSGDSVHSRNTIGFGNELIPSQFYGQCRNQ